MVKTPKLLGFIETLREIKNFDIRGIAQKAKMN